MGRWFLELKSVLGDDIILHVVGTKSDMVAEHPNKRQVPFERCIAYVAENLHPQPPPSQSKESSIPSGLWGIAVPKSADSGMMSPLSNRSSGLWGQDIGWDCCHEISAKDGEGVEEVFRVITRKLVEQRNKALEAEAMRQGGLTPGINGQQNGYFDYQHGINNGSFRLGVGDKRRSWLSFPPTPGFGGSGGGGGGGGAGQTPQEWEADIQRTKTKGSRCC